MKFAGYYHEKPDARFRKILSTYNSEKQKRAVWDAFVASALPGITDDDFSIVPRILPASYWPAIKKSAFLITQFCMRLLSLPDYEIRAIVPPGPIRDHLLNELQVLKFRNGRITGSFRFDMAIVGAPTPDNPPYLLEINEIGFDGLARSSFFQKTLLDLMPNARKRMRSLDTAAAEVRNMRRLGKKVARVQYDSYNWDEEYLLRTALKMGSEVRLVSPRQFDLDLEENMPLLSKERIRFKNGRAYLGQWRPDAVNMSFAYELHDYVEGHALYRKLVRAKTPQYGPFLTGLVAAKTILILLADPFLQRKLMGTSKALSDSILPACLLSDEVTKDLLRHPRDLVLKHTDGCGGEQVFMDAEMVKRIKRIPAKERHEWVLQEKTALNLIDLNGILSKPKKGISDLGVFVQYDWSHGKFQHFEVGGLMTRATNRSLKVNVSGGGCQVAVLLDRAT